MYQASNHQMIREKKNIFKERIRNIPRPDKETKLPAKKPSSLHEHDLDYSSYSSSRTLFDKSDNRWKTFF